MSARVKLSPASTVILVTETWPGFQAAKAEDVTRYKRAQDQLVAAHDSLLEEVAELRELIADAGSITELRRAVVEMDERCAAEEHGWCRSMPARRGRPDSR